ncbi:MAG: PTS sorbitol transporter subunit IIB, partial [Lachnospiraceae bacterium]|nr:PTS sorbitol transporter subunit IIB [Lachnospiraceae bacterium]
MAEYRAIRVEKGSGGFGGPLTIQGTEKKNKVMYITGGGVAPEILQRIVDLSGLEPVNGFKTSCPEDELALVIIDCGGTLRCGLYPKKRIPTININ